MNSNTWNSPCAEWAEKLAALHPDDLTSVEQEELKTHLASCTNCAETYQDYHHLANQLSSQTSIEVAPDLLPGLPELPAESEETTIQSTLISQPGTSASLPARTAKRRSRRTLSVAIAAIAAMLVIGVLLGNFTMRGQLAISGGASQKGNYVITPQGGSTPLPTTVTRGSPMILAGPTPPFFLNGSVYLNNNVYRADTGALIQQYLTNLGNVGIYNPRLVDGVLYMAVRTAPSQGPGKMIMYALRASDGTVLWRWDDCGESVNMSSPTIINGSVYFTCEAAPSLYKLYALQAQTGKLLWVNTWSGEVALNVPGDQQAIYIQFNNQLLAERLDTGKVLWEKTFQANGSFIDQTILGQGMLYVSQGTTFFALRTSDGTQMWKYQFVGDYSPIEAIVDQSVVYLFVSEQNKPGSIYALDSTSGNLHWKKQLDKNEIYGFPVIDHGNIYMAVDVLDNASQGYFQSFNRALLAIQGSDGNTLWQQNIPWNKGKLVYSMMEPPMVSAGNGHLYLTDWQPTSNLQNLTTTLGAFNESNGALLWTRAVL